MAIKVKVEIDCVVCQLKSSTLADIEIICEEGKDPIAELKPELSLGWTEVYSAMRGREFLCTKCSYDRE